MMDRKYIRVTNPYTGEEVSVAVTSGTQVWNPHRWDGEPTGSFWRRTKEVAVSDGNTTFHLDTNNPDGVIGTAYDPVIIVNKI